MFFVTGPVDDDLAGEEVIGRIEGGELLSAGAPRSDRRDASPGSLP